MRHKTPSMHDDPFRACKLRNTLALPQSPRKVKGTVIFLRCAIWRIKNGHSNDSKRKPCMKHNIVKPKHQETAHWHEKCILERHNCRRIEHEPFPRETSTTSGLGCQAFSSVSVSALACCDYSCCSVDHSCGRRCCHPCYSSHCLSFLCQL